MSKAILIAVVSCHRFRARADAQRRTWVPHVRNADVRFFLGNGGRAERADEVMLDTADDYQSLPYKVQAAFQWALAHGYDYVFKTDDDVYIRPERLLESDFRHDYVGALRPSLSEGSPAAYASGFAYWVSRAAMEVLVSAKINDWAEDRWVGNSLYEAGIRCHADYRYTVIHAINARNPISGTEGPRASNDVIAAAELDPGMMQRIHAEWLGVRWRARGFSLLAAQNSELQTAAND